MLHSHNCLTIASLLSQTSLCISPKCIFPKYCIYPNVWLIQHTLPMAFCCLHDKCYIFRIIWTWLKDTSQCTSPIFIYNLFPHYLPIFFSSQIMYSSCCTIPPFFATLLIILCFSFCGYVMNYWELSGVNKYLLCSWNLRVGTGGQLVWSTMCGASSEWLECWRLRSSEYSFNHKFRGWCWLLSGSLSFISHGSHHIGFHTWPLCINSFFHSVLADFPPKRKPYGSCILLHNLGSEVTYYYFCCILFLGEITSLPRFK